MKGKFAAKSFLAANNYVKKRIFYMKKFFTSESVTEGHPDKVCDQISDGILDAILAEDPMARTAIECCAAYDLLLIMGEVTTTAKVDYERTARGIIKKIGYDFGSFSYDKCKIVVAIHEQSPDIAMGVDRKDAGAAEDTLGAGDQGMMFGYACRETEELMPLPITLAHRLTKTLADARKSGEIPYLRPDGKAQVTVEYDGGAPVRVDTVVLSTQHDENVDYAALKSDITEKIIKAAVPAELMDENTKIYINPTGKFIIGGPHGDSGVTGRKIIVDTYGGMCPHGGGAFSGKDPTKVDRSACYYARYVCKNLVAAGVADRLQLQVAYAIGKAQPVSLCVDTFGTGKVSDERIMQAIKQLFDFRPYSIIKNLGLKSPIYSRTTNYGHFGKSYLPWEITDKTEDIKSFLGLK